MITNLEIGHLKGLESHIAYLRDELNGARRASAIHVHMARMVDIINEVRGHHGLPLYSAQTPVAGPSEGMTQPTWWHHERMGQHDTDLDLRTDIINAVTCAHHLCHENYPDRWITRIFLSSKKVEVICYLTDQERAELIAMLPGVAP